jgi:hypothetical protein
MAEEGVLDPVGLKKKSRLSFLKRHEDHTSNLKECQEVFMNFLKGLVVSGAGGLSLGRVTCWLVLVPALWAWTHGRDIPHGHLVTLLACFGYVFGGKFRSMIKTKDIEFDKPEGEGRK